MSRGDLRGDRSGSPGPSRHEQACGFDAATIARDELRHAELAWDLARWIERQLSAAERNELTRLRRALLEEFAAAPIVTGHMALAPAGRSPDLDFGALRAALSDEVAHRWNLSGPERASS